MSYIYIAPLKDKSAFKVGKSTTPSKRIQHLSKFYDFDMDDITLMYCGDENGAYTLESVLHAVLREHQKIKEFEGGTEFFDFYHYNNAIQLLYDIADINNLTPEQLIVDFDIEPMGSFLDLTLSALGKRCAARRLELNLSQEYLANAAAVGHRTVQRLEAGSSVNTSCLLQIMQQLEMDCSLEPVKSNTRKRAS